MGETVRPEELSHVVMPDDDADYANMPVGEVAYRALRNLPGSVYEAGKGIVQAGMHPIDTAKALGDVGYGFGSMAYGAMGGEQDPVEKQQNEALARAVVEPYTSVPAFKKEFAENPAGPLSLLLPGGGGALTKTGSLLSKAGKIGEIAATVPRVLGRTAEIAGAAVDPARAILEGGRAVRKFGPRVATGLQHLTTGSPSEVFAKAFEAGADRSPHGPAIREGFNRFYHGHGDVVGLSQDIEKAVDDIRDKASKEWINNRGAVTGAATAPIDYSGINSALMDAWKNYGGHPRAKTGAFPQERAALMDAMKLVNEYSRFAPGGGKNNLAGLDELKRALWARAQNAPGGAADAYKKVHAAVRQTLENTSPEYAKLMDEYQTLIDEMQGVRKAVGAGSQLDPNAQLARAIQSFRTPGRAQMLERVAEADPTIPFKIAGAALNQNRVGIRQVIAGATTAGPAIANALASGDPMQIAKIIPSVIGGMAVSSPGVMGKASYLTGRAAGAAGAMGDIPLGVGTVGDIVSGATKAVYPTALAAEHLKFGQDRLGSDVPVPVEGGYFNFEDPPAGQQEFIEDAHGNKYDVHGNMLRGESMDDPALWKNAGGRVGRKTGGRVKGNKISAEVKRVRAMLSQRTASILSMPDDAVATALHIAKGK